ncbi:MAG TPA: hypothetical protein VIY49_05790, partial [Bryobacteraceae bacterium]
WRVRLSLFCMRICIRPQNARPAHPHFMIILYWKPVPFHDHLVLDNSHTAEASIKWLKWEIGLA